MPVIACHSWTFSDLSRGDAFGTLARLGFRAVDLGSGPHLNLTEAAKNPARAAADVCADLDLYHLKLTDLYLMLPRISLAEADLRAKEVEQFKALLPFAAAVGAPGITLSPGLAHAVTDQAAVERTIEALRAMSSAAKAVQMPLSIEPRLDSMAETPETALALLDAVPDLGVTLDAAHFITQGMPLNVMTPLLPKVRHVHVRPAAKGHLQTPFDKGTLNLNDWWSALLGAGYAGNVSIEYINTPGSHGMIEVNVVREVDRLREALKPLVAGPTDNGK